MPTILIIDAQPDELEHLRETLGQSGYRVESVPDVEDARPLIESALSIPGQPGLDAVVLDWEQSGKSVELLRWLHEIPGHEHLEVIIQSAGSTGPGSLPPEVEEGLEKGEYYYLRKPFQALQLQGLVSAALASHQLKESLHHMTARIQDCFALLATGTFEIRTMDEAELLSAHIGSACDDPQRGIGVLELLVNGVEHGNLGISYEEKTRLLASGTYEAEVERRLALEENKYKSVRVNLTRLGDHLQVLITDCGPGFDYERYFTFDRERFFDRHGRGILLARAAVEVEYFDPGSQVRVTLPVHSEEEP